MSDLTTIQLEQALIEDQRESTIFKVAIDVDGIIRTPNKVNSDVLDCNRVAELDDESLLRLRDILPSKSVSYLRVHNEIKSRNAHQVLRGNYANCNRGIDSSFSYLIPIIDVHTHDVINDSDTAKVPH